MEGPLSVCPLELPLLLAEVFLPCERNLQKDEHLSCMIHGPKGVGQDSLCSTCYYYPLIDDEIPCFAAQSVSDEELDDIEREVCDDIVEPHDASPAPPDAFDLSERPVSIHRDQCSNL